MSVLRLLILSLSYAALVLGSSAAQLVEVENIPLSSGGSQRALYASPASPRAALVMLPGGDGNVGIGDGGGMDHDTNFLVRTRDLWLSHGYAVLIVDALSGKNMRGLRSSPGYARIIEDVVRFAVAKRHGPVFLFGTSQGSIGAINGASHMPEGLLKGVVLTETVTRLGKSGETAFDASPERVAVPALVVANKASQCRVAPAEDASPLAKAMSGAPEVKIVYVDGGETLTRECGSQSPHGYFGIEKETVAEIAAWLNAH